MTNALTIIKTKLGYYNGFVIWISGLGFGWGWGWLVGKTFSNWVVVVAELIRGGVGEIETEEERK